MTKSGRGKITKVSIAAASLVSVFFIGAGIFVFQDNISRFLINPRTPFQTSIKPPAPDYHAPTAWALHPMLLDSSTSHNDRRADIFYIHDTTYSSNESWNAAIDHKEASSVLTQIALPNEVGPFLPLGIAYAPRYRQATLFAKFTHKYDGFAAYELAYSDVRRSFALYLEQADSDRPLFIVGYGQGALHAAGLVQEFVALEPIVRRRVVAVYLIDRGMPKSSFPNYAPDKLSPCERAASTECIVAYTHFSPSFEREITEARRRTVMWGADQTLKSVSEAPLLCINPLTWQIDGSWSDNINHKGAASATGLLLDQDPPMLRSITGAACVDGVLITDRPAKPFLQRKKWFGRQWRNQPFNLFYGDLREDAHRRLLLHEPILANKVRQLAPINNLIDLGDSPIKKVPN